MRKIALLGAAFAFMGAAAVAVVADDYAADPDPAPRPKPKPRRIAEPAVEPSILTRQLLRQRARIAAKGR